MLGTLLGFDQTAMSKIASVAGSAESYLEQLITKWLCGDSSLPPTLKSLIAALRNSVIDEEEIALSVLRGMLTFLPEVYIVLYNVMHCVIF